LEYPLVAIDKNPDSINLPPFETEELRKNLATYLDTEFEVPGTSERGKVGNFRWGVYAFFDYDHEPIYVGQTNELVRTRIRRHLTNQRTDAVAMSVLDPFEVFEIEVWPLPQFQKTGRDNQEARAHLNALEYQIFRDAISKSKFGVVLNEKDPPAPSIEVSIPTSVRGCIVSSQVHSIRSHPDFRIARRALVIARLAQVISERKVQGGLRRVMLAQAQRLQWLAERRFQALGGESSVEEEKENSSEGEE
jgi:hypothetical protein